MTIAEQVIGNISHKLLFQWILELVIVPALLVIIHANSICLHQPWKVTAFQTNHSCIQIISASAKFILQFRYFRSSFRSCRFSVFKASDATIALHDLGNLSRNMKKKEGVPMKAHKHPSSLLKFLLSFSPQCFIRQLQPELSWFSVSPFTHSELEVSLDIRIHTA